MTEQSKENKIHIAFAASPEIVESIEDTVFFLRKELSPDKKKKLTRSMLFEAALNYLVTEYKTNGSKNIFKMLEEKINLKS